jgi:hypothetical protein
MQEDCCILFPALENTGNWRQKAWRYTRTPGLGDWLGSLPETPHPDLSSRSFESGARAEQSHMSE